MRRTGLALALLLTCLAAGGFAALALADVAPPGSTTSVPTDTTTTSTDTTTTAPAPAAIADGVTIGGVATGGLAPADARTAVQQAFERPVVLRYGRVTVQVSPDALGALAELDAALATAQTAPPGTAVPLRIGVPRAGVSQFVARVVRRFAHKPVDAQLHLRGLRPVITQAEPGRSFALPPITDAVVKQLLANVRRTIVLRPKLTRPKVLSVSFGSIVVIRRSENRLFLYDGTRLVHTFGVATGQAAYPTPLGHFQIIVKWKNPWWYPPASPWARGEKPTPPGPGNPLGTRWMGISSPGVGIHGTPDAASIGYSASHGCIRMRIPDAEWLFEHVDVGSPVFIVAG